MGSVKLELLQTHYLNLWIQMVSALKHRTHDKTGKTVYSLSKMAISKNI